MTTATVLDPSTTLTPPGRRPGPAPAGQARWYRPALAGLLLGTAVLYLWGLGASGWANSFYAAAAQAGSGPWKAFFFGAASTVAYAVLFLLLRGPFSGFTANLLALLVTAVANTAANRRLTFGVRGPGGAVRHQVRGLVVFGIGVGVTSGSLGLLHASGRDHHGAEVVVLTVANLVVTLMRFAAMRVWVFARRTA
jgi:hypothetical protein